MGQLKRCPALLAFTLACSTALASTPAVAQRPPSAAAVSEARAHWNRGVKFYEEGAYELAGIELQRAYSLAPNYRILYNMGSVALRVGDYAAAHRAFEKYLSDGGSEIPSDRRNEVDTQLEWLRIRIARVEVVVNVEGAEVLVDDVAIGKTPLAQPVLVNAGKRKFTASKEGTGPVSRVVIAAGGESTKVQLELVSNETLAATPGDGAGTAARAASTSPAAPSAASATNAQPHDHSVPWVAWGITGALAATSAVTGVLSWSASRDLKSVREAPSADPGDLDSRASKVKTLALATDALLAATAVAGGVSLYLTLRSPSRAEPTPALASTQLRVVPGGVLVTGSF